MFSSPTLLSVFSSPAVFRVQFTSSIQHSAHQQYSAFRSPAALRIQFSSLISVQFSSQFSSGALLNTHFSIVKFSSSSSSQYSLFYSDHQSFAQVQAVLSCSFNPFSLVQSSSSVTLLIIPTSLHTVLYQEYISG